MSYIYTTNVGTEDLTNCNTSTSMYTVMVQPLTMPNSILAMDNRYIYQSKVVFRSCILEINLHVGCIESFSMY